jgi:uncharacterized protein YqgV (UPF0045/DUF77 family)
MDNIKYCNEVMGRLEALMFQELSGMAYWKCEFVGADFIRSKNIQGKNVSEIVENCIKEMKAAGIVSDIAYKVGPDGIMLKLKVKNCMHIAKEAQVKAEGVHPYICPISNMILDQIHDKLKYETSYLAKLAIDEKNHQCLIYIALYETAEKIGQVSDWLKDDEDLAWLKSQPSQILAAADRKK